MVTVPLRNHWNLGRGKRIFIIIKLLDYIREGKEELPFFSKIIENAFEYGMNDDTQIMTATKGTLFDAHNHVTGYYQKVQQAMSTLNAN